jgi:hypothetical protein
MQKAKTLTAHEQEAEEAVQYHEDNEQDQEDMQENMQAESVVEQGIAEQELKKPDSEVSSVGRDRGSFIHGLCVGIGLGCITTFIIMWVTVFFTPRLPSGITYENMLAIFIYPLVYLLAVGLVALTAGIVREYFSARN